MSNIGEKAMTVLLVVAGLAVGGCWLTSDNPDAPSVEPQVGRPENWPVFKGTNEVPTNAVVSTNLVVSTNAVKPSLASFFGCSRTK